MLDIGIIGSKKTEEYETKFLNELTPGEEISGEIYVGEIKKTALEKSESYEFAVILTDHEDKKKWVCKLTTSYYPETGNIYGEKGGRIYIFIDTLNHALNKDPLNSQDSYSVNFNTFRTAINDNISKVTVNAVKPINPHAKYVNLTMINAESEGESPPSDLEVLTGKNAVVNIAYNNLQNERKEVTIQNIAFELKAMLNRDEITDVEFKNSLKALDDLPKS